MGDRVFEGAFTFSAEVFYQDAIVINQAPEVINSATRWASHFDNDRITAWLILTNFWRE